MFFTRIPVDKIFGQCVYVYISPVDNVGIFVDNLFSKVRNCV